MDQEAAPIEHPVTDEDVETACQIGVGTAWQKMTEIEKKMYRKYFRKFLESYGVRHQDASKA